MCERDEAADTEMVMLRSDALIPDNGVQQCLRYDAWVAMKKPT
jgi:hypothetical protein